MSCCKSLLLCCARCDWEQALAAGAEPLADSRFDWSSLIAAADAHAVLPLIYYRLKTVCPEAIPPAVRCQLEQRYCINALRNALLASEAVRVTHLLEAHAIRAVAFKGAALSLALYDNLLFRQFGDVDVYIGRADLARAESLLAAHGYQSALSPRERNDFLRHRYHLHYTRPHAQLPDGSQVHLEIHWAFTPRYWPFPLDEQQIWAGRREFGTAGATLAGLDPEHTLLVLCAHGGKERWARLQLICDVAALLCRHRDLDWAWLLGTATSMRRERILRLGVGLAHGLLGAPLPERIIGWLQRDRQAERLRELVQQRLLADSGWPLRGRQLHAYFCRLWPRWSDRRGYAGEVLRKMPAAYARYLIPCEDDRSVVALPAHLHWLYYAIRPFRLAAKHCGPKAA